MSLGTLRHELTTCCAAADDVFWFRAPNIKWDLSEVVSDCVVPAQMFDQLERLIAAVVKLAQTQNKKTHVVIMSNGAFGGIYTQLVDALKQSTP